VLAEERAPESVVAHWISHTETLRTTITVDGPDECDSEARPHSPQGKP
jgi:hypothetical protein